MLLSDDRLQEQFTGVRSVEHRHYVPVFIAGIHIHGVRVGLREGGNGQAQNLVGNLTQLFIPAVTVSIWRPAQSR
jgi:hypothetical protein